MPHSSMLLLLLALLALAQPSRPETLIWADEFDTLDEDKWEHLVSTYPQARTRCRYLDIYNICCYVILTFVDVVF